jgi:beta-phosphoglucomutase-like phosphatase (HAD superfamily)
MPDLLLTDIDGTLVDSINPHCAADLALRPRRSVHTDRSPILLSLSRTVELGPSISTHHP